MGWSGDVDVGGPVPPLLVAAALCRTLADVLERIDDAAVDDAARAAVRRLAERLEAALTARGAD
jgi:hypothetical protein